MMMEALEPRTLLTAATGAVNILNAGQIAGWGKIDSHIHAFLMTPVSSQSTPEPGTWAVLGMAGVWVAARAGFSSIRSRAPTPGRQPLPRGNGQRRPALLRLALQERYSRTVGR